MRAHWLFLGVIALAGCKYDPVIPVGQVKCSTSNDCGSGTLCLPLGNTGEMRCCFPTGCPTLTDGAVGSGGAGGPGTGGVVGAGTGGTAGAPGGTGGCATPPECTMASTGTFCQQGQLASCTLVDGCVTGVLTACPADKPCQGAFPTANCSCPAPPAECAGISDGGKVCVGGQLVTCALNAQKCIEARPAMACAQGKVCAGPRGTADCVCGDACAAGDGCCPAVCTPMNDSDCQWELTGGITSAGGISTDPAGGIRLVDDGFELGEWTCDPAGMMCLSGGITP